MTALLAAAPARSAHATTLTDSDLGTAVELETPEVRVMVQKSPFHIAVETAGASPLLDEAPDVAQGSLAYFRGPTEYRVTQLGDPYTRVGDRVEFDVETTEGVGFDATVAIEFADDAVFFVELEPPVPGTVTEVAETFVSPAGERYYGLTERLITDGPLGSASELNPQEVGSLDRRGELVTMSVAATISIYTPFYHSSRGYGLFVDGPMQGSFDLANAQPDRVRIRFKFDPSAQKFAYHFFYGPSHSAILDHYTSLTGRPWLPPRWVYRHMRWRDEHAAGSTALLDGVPVNAALAEDIDMYETLGFPAPGWYNFDRPWTAGTAGGCPNTGFDRFAFDPARFPNAPQMIASLSARGIHTIVFNAPWACGNSSDPVTNAYEATLNGYYAPNSPDHIDFTNPAVTEWWQDKIEAFVTAMGISGFKLDRGDETVPSTSADIYFDGRNGLELHNDYPRLYVQAYHDRLQSVIPNDWVTMTRPGYAGSQAYGLYWGGDITGADTFGLGAATDKGLRSAIISLQRLAFMGFPNWGTDTGGYYQFKQRDVFARWLEFSAFCPVMEIGGGLRFGDAINGPHAPWDMPTTPNYDPEMIDIYRYYTWLHHELVPYSYSEGVRANQTGHPIATPLVFEYPADGAVADMWDEYLYGPWLLVAPLWRDGDRARDVYLPGHAWTNYWDDSEYHLGPTTLTGVTAPLGRLPLYIKLGAILPLDVVNNVTGHGTAASAGRLTLALYPHQSSSYDLHQASGTVTVTSDKLGNYAGTAAITITTSTATVDYLLRVKANCRPASVTLNSGPLAACADQAAFDGSLGGCAWLYGVGGRVFVKYSTAASAATVVITPGDSLLCGNGVVDAAEDCDDGDVLGGDGCGPTCVVESGDHYKCYKGGRAAGAPPFAKPVVDLTDSIETATMTAVKPVSVCNPAQPPAEGIADPSAHLACYKLRKLSGGPEFTQRHVQVGDEFGQSNLTLIKPDALCIPSEVDGEPSYLSLDNFKCYKARRTRGAPKFERRDRVFGDGFEVKSQTVVKPTAVCTAVDLDGAGRRVASAAFTCYKVKAVEGAAAFTERDVAIDNIFGLQDFTAKKARAVCVPAELTVLP